MIYPFDFHIHTDFCDGKDAAEDIVKAAIDKGLKTIGFSSHSYTPFDTDYCMNEQDTKDYLAQIKLLKEKGYWIFGTDMDGTDYTKLDYKGKTCIICGNEGFGISKLVRENCDFIASIPMQGEVNSLNASVATAIIVFEAIKQRG